MGRLYYGKDYLSNPTSVGTHNSLKVHSWCFLQVSCMFIFTDKQTWIGSSRADVFMSKWRHQSKKHKQLTIHERS